MNTILIFDVETTGLIPKGPKILELYPHILQLSFVLYDVSENQIVQTYNSFINVPKTVTIVPFVTNLTGIDRELLDKKGVNIKECLTMFHIAYLKADKIVAHNSDFDMEMILTESIRSYSSLKDDIKKINKPIVCTMKNSVDICRIKRVNSRGSYIKFPSLLELYKHLFLDVPLNLHDSRIDVLCCLRCFLKIELDYTMSDVEFDSIVYN
jgi:DNA polymerase III alpha subunit (gram-positive type)